MKKLWFPFFARDWFSDPKVRRLTRQARGTYIDMLAQMWLSKDCRLPKDISRLSRILGIPQDELSADLAEIQDPEDPILREGSKYYYSNRLLQEYKKAVARSERARNAARGRWSCDAPSNAPSNARGNARKDARAMLGTATYINAFPSGKARERDFKNNHWSNRVGDWFESIEKRGFQIIDLIKKTHKFKRFNPWQYVQHALKTGLHPGLIDEVLGQIIGYWDNIGTNPWAYTSKFKKIKQQNWNEREAIEIHEYLKAMDPGELAELTRGLLKRA